MHKKYELPISIEKFAAYLDGQLPKEEMERIGILVEKDDLLRAMLDTSDSIDSLADDKDELFELPKNEDIHIPVPDIDATENIGDISDSVLNENVQSFLIEETSISEDGDRSIPDEDSIMANDNTEHTMKDMKTYGYEPNYELDTFDPNIYQGYCNTCAIRSQEIILRDYGIMIPQEDLMRYAEQKGWFNPDPEEGGTDPETIGNILDDCGVQTSRTQDATIYDIIAELRAGRRVIVGVDAKELWLKKEPNLIKRLFTNIVNHANDNVQDFLDMEGATHALIVAGVNVNPSDPSDIHVTLIDPGTGEMCVEYTFKEFEKAWEDSHHRMIATNSPAPYQYNYETHQMEPSGFTSDFIPSNIHLPEDMTNSFHLSETYYTTYEDYNEFYSDNHLIPFKASTSHTMEHGSDDEGHDDETEFEHDDHNDDESAYGMKEDEQVSEDNDDDEEDDEDDDDDDDDNDDNDVDDDNDDDSSSSGSDEDWDISGSEIDESSRTENC